MAAYAATVLWERAPGEAFAGGRYGRGHDWAFDGGQRVRASAAPSHVPRGAADPFGVDPEEAFVAALSSCHMLFFLFHAARAGLVVDRYEDAAEGIMAAEGGRSWMAFVTLRPRVAWGGAAPDAAALRALHHAAHADCYLANSVRTEVRCEPVT